MWWKRIEVVGGIVGLALVSACLAPTRPTAPASVPAAVTRQLEGLAPAARQAYLFALARPDVLRYLPCYCGCASLGHTSNLDCFVRPTATGREVALESHGAT
jgi:hypothetical protein